jgi:ammonium transporter, Amt family
MLGPRRDFGRIATVPHNVPFTLLGAGLLWFGWFGFNAGSALGASGVAANALLTTHAGASAGVVAWLCARCGAARRATAVGAATGAVVGLVAITPAAGFVTPLGALAIGVLSAPLSFAALHMRAKSRVDDTLDVFACHGVAGISGALLTGVFATTTVNPDGANGALYGNVGLLWVQLVAVVATMIFAGVASVAILSLVRAIMPVRVPVSAEVMGIDLSEHGEEAYHGSDLSDLTGKRMRPRRAGDPAGPRRIPQSVRRALPVGRGREPRTPSRVRGAAPRQNKRPGREDRGVFSTAITRTISPAGRPDGS